MGQDSHIFAWFYAKLFIESRENKNRAWSDEENFQLSSYSRAEAINAPSHHWPQQRW